MKIQIVERDMIWYICGKTKLPTKSYAHYEKLYVKNKKVKQWLLISMSS